jgi:hypothetical protein
MKSIAVRSSLIYALLLGAGCFLVGWPAAAQPAKIVPLVPRVPAVLPWEPAVGVPVALSASAVPLASVVARPAAAVPAPLFILNSQVVIDNGLVNIKPDDVQALHVYKGTDAPRLWRNLTTYGIIDITPKPRAHAEVKSRTLTEIGRLFGAEGSVRYSINGMPTSEAGIRVANAAIGQVKVTHATAPGAITWVDIQIAHKEIPKPAPTPGSPPRIMIRGAASL